MLVTVLITSGQIKADTVKPLLMFVCPYFVIFAQWTNAQNYRVWII